MSAQNRVNK